MGVFNVTDEVCEGCGVPLQSEDPDAPGYVPPHVAGRGEQVVCRRCYRINHYGKEDLPVQIDEDDAWAMVLDVVGRVDLCVMVVDVVDFEGCYLPSLARAAGRLIVAANKVDLLPTKTPAEEVVAWVRDRLRSDGIACEGIYPISASKGYGVRVLFEAAKRAAGRKGRVGLVGATNVGKSTLLSRWLKGTGEEGPTVSRLPGTTLGVIQKEVGRSELEIVDTPGLTTKGRLTDILCRTCAQRLVPEAPLTSKLVKFGPGQSVAIGGLAAVTPVDIPGDQELIALVFAAGEVPVHRVKELRLERWLKGDAVPGQSHLCGACRASLGKDGWEQVVVDVAEMEDVAIHGLGWLSPRKSGLTVRVTVPAGTMVSARPRLIGPKEPVAALKRPGANDPNFPV